MKNFIEELYYGNLDSEFYGSNDREFSKALRKTSDLEEQLNKIVDDSAKAVFSDYLEASSELSRLSVLDAFRQGFRMGAHFMHDTFL